MQLVDFTERRSSRESSSTWVSTVTNQQDGLQQQSTITSTALALQLHTPLSLGVKLGQKRGGKKVYIQCMGSDTKCFSVLKKCTKQTSEARVVLPTL